MKKIIIVGAGGFAREVVWLINEINEESKQWDILGYIDENLNNKGKVLNGYEVLGDFKTLKNIKSDVYYVCAIGNPKTKEKLVDKAEKLGLHAAILIHPNVRISKYVDIGQGTIICAGNIITVNISIGKHVIINLDCTIGHDVIIGDYSTVLPSVNLSGNVLVNKYVNIGTGVQVIQGKKIGENSIIGAGAVVVSEIPENCTAVGCPAKILKKVIE